MEILSALQIIVDRATLLKMLAGPTKGAARYSVILITDARVYLVSDRRR
jgi:hypothetical protein